jgi:hypothetical protein
MKSEMVMSVIDRCWLSWLTAYYQVGTKVPDADLAKQLKTLDMTGKASLFSHKETHWKGTLVFSHLNRAVQMPHRSSVRHRGESIRAEASPASALETMRSLHRSSANHSPFRSANGLKNHQKMIQLPLQCWYFIIPGSPSWLKCGAPKVAKLVCNPQ